jgi:hypothetical protein
MDLLHEEMKSLLAKNKLLKRKAAPAEGKIYKAKFL